MIELQVGYLMLTCIALGVVLDEMVRMLLDWRNEG